MNDIKLNRRQVVTGACEKTLGLGFLALAGKAHGAGAGSVLVSGFTPGNLAHYSQRTGSGDIAMAGEYLQLKALKSGAGKAVLLRDRVHAVIPSPANPGTLLIMTKPGTESYIWQQKSGGKLARFSALEGNIFSGHGAFSPDGRVIYVGEVRDKKGEGIITVRDAQSGQVLRVIQGYGRDPHEMALLDHGTIIVQANVLDEGSALCFIDVSSGKLIETFKSDVKGQIFRHFFFVNDNEFVIGCKLDERVSAGPEQTAVLLFGRRGKGNTGVLSMRDVGAGSRGGSWQFLSLAWNQETNVVGATSDTNDCVVFADAGTGKLVGSLNIEKPTGIVFSASVKRYYINTLQGLLFEVDPVSLKATKLKEQIEMTGPHLYELSLVI